VASAFFTLGHSTRPVAELAGLLQQAGAGVVVVRRRNVVGLVGAVNPPLQGLKKGRVPLRLIVRLLLE